jgi:hypothetical protein
MKTLITALVGQRKNVGVVAALLTAGAVAGWAMSATFATITAAVEDLPAFEISDMKKLPLEEFKRGLIGSYAVTGTDPSGQPYGGGGVLDIALPHPAPSSWYGTTARMSALAKLSATFWLWPVRPRAEP